MPKRKRAAGAAVAPVATVNPQEFFTGKRAGGELARAAAHGRRSPARAVEAGAGNGCGPRPEEEPITMTVDIPSPDEVRALFEQALDMPAGTIAALAAAHRAELDAEAERRRRAVESSRATFRGDLLRVLARFAPKG